MENDLKKINITGVNNKYQVNKLIKENRGKKEQKKRVVSEKWNFPEEFFEYNNQMILIKNILNNNYTSNDDISKIIIQQISQKIQKS